MNLSYEHQLVVWNNINTIRKTLDENPAYIKDSYMNFLEEKTNNSDAKKRYKEITKYIDNKNPEVISKINEAQDKTDKEINKMNKEMISKNVDLEEINATTWDYEMADPRVEINNCKNDRNDLNCHRYTDTYRYIKRTELEQQEDNYLASLNFLLVILKILQI